MSTQPFSTRTVYPQGLSADGRWGLQSIAIQAMVLAAASEGYTLDRRTLVLKERTERRWWGWPTGNVVCHLSAKGVRV